MDNNKTLIICAIALVIVILGGIVFSTTSTTPEPVENVGDVVKAEVINESAYQIPLGIEEFKNFEIATPEGSNFTLKNNVTDTDRGMKYYQNSGNYTNDVLGIAIAKNMTDSLILEKSELIMDNDTKVYVSDNVNHDMYQAVRTFNDTDIIVTGSNLPLIEEMLDNATVKDTNDLTKAVKAPVNKTPVQKVVEKTKKTKVNKTKVKTESQKTKTKKTQNVEKTADKTKKTANKNKKTKTKKTQNVEKTATKEEKPEVETTSEPAVETTSEDTITKTTYPLIIGGGMFTTGSELEDLTYAQIYVGPEHAGETVMIKILYSRDGTALNQGNLVTKVVEDDGYIYIASADAYSKYPDYATVKVYDWQGNLQNTQGISLETRSGTQYF